MSEFFDEKIILNVPKRNYYTNSKTLNLKTAALDSSPEVSGGNITVDINRTSPAGIPPTNAETPSSVSTNDTMPQEILSSYVRFYSLIQNGTGVTIYVNGKKAASDIAFEQVTDYMTINPGLYTISFYSSGDNSTLLSEYNLRAFPGMGTTLIIYENGGIYSVLEISGSAPKCYYNSAYVRFVQLSPAAPAMDIYLDGIAVTAGLRYMDAAAYIVIPSGVHTITAVASGTGMIFIDEQYNFPSSSVSNIFIIPDGEGLMLSAITDQNSCS